MIKPQIRKWKTDCNGINHSYFLRDMHLEKSVFKSHVYLISYDIYIHESSISSALPRYSVAYVNMGFIV